MLGIEIREQREVSEQSMLCIKHRPSRSRSRPHQDAEPCAVSTLTEWGAFALIFLEHNAPKVIKIW